VVSGTELSPGHPVDLAFDSVSGLSYRRRISVDNHYMFTVADTVTNTSNHPISAQLTAVVYRQGLPVTLGRANAFEGAIGVFPADGKSPDKKLGFKDKAWRDGAQLDADLHVYKKVALQQTAQGGWFGLTDKYWMGAVVPTDQKAPVTGVYEFTSPDVADKTQAPNETFRAEFATPAQTIAPGASIQKSVDVFAGPKKNDLLEKTYSWVPNFRLAIDWGWVWFVSQPIFWLLQNIRAVVVSVFGNFPQALGVSILLLTVIVRGAMFPLALQSYSSMSKMKKVQPLIEEVRKKYKDDPAKLQQEQMALYQREKINPIAGCLPMLATIPVFFALANVLFVSIELRQAPFFGWVHDLAAPDPTTVWNLFGAIPWDPSSLPYVGTFFAGFLHIGVWPLLYGLTTFLQMQMSPTSTDPTQQAMMKFMPFMFMAFLATYPAGLLIYYVWSNCITIGQQWFMMNRHGVENPIDGVIKRIRDRLVDVRGKTKQ
jgi:YidC/Oxa1 family membrane protein insertase